MARRSRTAAPAAPQRQRVWRTALYIRLSREDARSLEESESVVNQRAIIEEYISGIADGDEYMIVGEYVDDGISGTTDDEREGFQKMLADIRKGRINCVIVKDLARSFRNYSDQGYYLDDWFPRYNVRFISLFHQPLDSYKEPQNMRSIAVPIQGVLNENHCAETSDKVREVFDMKRRAGEHIGSFAVYGYRKDPQNKNALLVDQEAAEVVRGIFNMFLDGMSKNAIVHYLNDHGVLCPAAYKRERLGLNYQNPGIDPARRPLWCAGTISGILKNRMYCGDMVQGRYRIKSYKVHIQEQVPEEEWYIVENTHEAIVDRITFEKAGRLLLRDTRSAPRGQQLYLFSGFLRCADCGRSMSRSRVGNAVYYYCRTYKDRSKYACTRHQIKHEGLEQAVLRAIQQQIYLEADIDQMLQQVCRTAAPRKHTGPLENALRQKEQELEKIIRYKQAIYQDWKDAEITYSEYRHMKADYQEKEDCLHKAIMNLDREKKELVAATEKEGGLFQALRQSRNIVQLSRDILIELVDSVTVYEGGGIKIKFRFSHSAHTAPLSCPLEG